MSTEVNANVIKRNGVEVIFDKAKIINAVEKANEEVPKLHRLSHYQITALADMIATRALESSHAVNVEDIQDMVETEKYLKLIEERNHELEKEREKEKKEPREEKKSSYQAIKPEIRINPEYFKKAGIPLEDEEPEEDAAEGKKEIPEVTVDLDAEYFKWKAKEKDNKKK